MTSLPQIPFQRGSHKTEFHGSWYRGPHTNFLPSKAELQEPNAVEKFVLPGWLPEAPFIDKTTPITAFGSCFAANISEILTQRGYNVFGRNLDIQAHIVRFGEGIVNSFAVRQQFESGKPLVWSEQGNSRRRQSDSLGNAGYSQFDRGIYHYTRLVRDLV
jgi:hypothetical protein